MKTSLNGRIALVTGGGRRIGRVIVEGLAGAGADVAVHYRTSEAEASEAARAVEGAGRRAALVQGDLADSDVPARLLAEAAGALGPVDLLVNNASVFPPEDWEETDADLWDRTFAVNLRAPFLLSQAFARALPEHRKGRIVNLLDARAIRPDRPAYTASKGGLEVLTRALAGALASRITVNGLALGAILPPEGESEGSLLEGIPAGRWGTPEEVARALLFLAAGPSYINGEILHLDGGWGIA